MTQFTLLDKSSSSSNSTLLRIRLTLSARIAVLTLTTGLKKLPPLPAVEAANSLLQCPPAGLTPPPDPVQQHTREQKKQLPSPFSC
jgi:hypothetical protein